ncbi:IclR helix-turn-helix domain [Micromonospora nigra]|uniref:IclR helix-turn-helix domain n=1 Tax=Micromonospora nigra TaxID=145857 RepID=A0A1C6RAH3_9ACTN|nr:hypothetical protein [Micromonospora nigra]SCL13969.1 IclR helix-turn-helix domain [Micromonospora nigra]
MSRREPGVAGTAQEAAARRVPAVTTTTAADDVLLVAVPTAYVPDVVRLLAELEAERRPVPAPESSRPPRAAAPRHGPRPQHRGGQWPVEQLRRFSRGRSSTHRTVIAVLDTLAADPGRAFTLTELAAATGMPREKLVGAFAGLTRLLKAHFEYERHGLPFARITGRPDGSPNDVSYLVTKKQAASWQRVRGD